MRGYGLPFAQRNSMTTFCPSTRPPSICRSPKASRLLLRTALELGTAGGAKVATVMGHARPGTADVRDVLLAEPHRVRFTGRTLLRGPLLRGGGPRRHREPEAQQHRRRGFHRPELLLGATNVHYRPPFGFCPGIYCQFNDPWGSAPTLAAVIFRSQ